MKKLVALALLLLPGSLIFACSSFLLHKNGQTLFGRNYDWATGNGMVLVNARGVKKTSFIPPGERSASWVSKWGSITFNQFGKEFPHGGINEKGLVVELMWLSSTGYPAPDGRGALNELQWIQYQLDNCTTIDDVIASDTLIRITREAAPLHYLVADASGRAATIEFIEGRMVVHKDAGLSTPVLTNTPYSEALGAINKKSSYRDNSIQRFATACRMVQQYQQSAASGKGIDYAFDILDKIAQGSYTKWRIVYDITNRQVHFVTTGGRRSLSLRDFDFSCRAQPLAYHLNLPGSGNIVGRFSPLTYEQNGQLVRQSARESRSVLSIPEGVLRGATAYYRQVSCR